MKDIALVGVRTNIDKGIRVKTSDPQHRTTGAKRGLNGKPAKGYISSDRPDGFAPKNGTGKKRTKREQRARERRHTRRRLARQNAMNGVAVNPAPALKDKTLVHTGGNIAMDTSKIEHDGMQPGSVGHENYHLKRGSGMHKNGTCRT